MLLLLRLVRRIPARVTLAAVIVAITLLPAATVTLSKGTSTRVSSRFNAAPPSASGAEPAYPLNHTFDADGGPSGTPPPNHDFEAAGTTAGTPPANSDFATAPTDAGAPPTNYDFASGDFTGWATTGSPTIQSASGHPNYPGLFTAILEPAVVNLRANLGE